MDSLSIIKAKPTIIRGRLARRWKLITATAANQGSSTRSYSSFEIWRTSNSSRGKPVFSLASASAPGELSLTATVSRSGIAQGYRSGASAFDSSLFSVLAWSLL